MITSRLLAAYLPDVGPTLVGIAVGGVTGVTVTVDGRIAQAPVVNRISSIAMSPVCDVPITPSKMIWIEENISSCCNFECSYSSLCSGAANLDSADGR